MTGWAMFWAFCALMVVANILDTYLAHRRVMWCIKNGYSYDKKTKLWRK